MLSFFRSKTVQCFAYEAGVLYFQSTHVLPVAKSHSVEAELPVREGDNLLKIKLKIRVEEEHPESALWNKRTTDLYGQPSKHFYSGTVESPREAIPHLERLLEGVPQPQELRRHQRVEKRLRAVSPELPGFRGTVTDLSSGGLGMLIDAPRERGILLRFEIDFEEQRLGRMELQGRICWCRPDPEGGYRIGVQFEGLSEDSQWHLRQVLEKLLAAEPGVIRDSNFLRG